MDSDTPPLPSRTDHAPSDLPPHPWHLCILWCPSHLPRALRWTTGWTTASTTSRGAMTAARPTRGMAPTSTAAASAPAGRESASRLERRTVSSAKPFQEICYRGFGPRVTSRLGLGLGFRCTIRGSELVSHRREWSSTTRQPRARGREVPGGSQQLLQRRRQVARHRLPPRQGHHLRAQSPSPRMRSTCVLLSCRANDVCIYTYLYMIIKTKFLKLEGIFRRVPESSIEKRFPKYQDKFYKAAGKQFSNETHLLLRNEGQTGENPRDLLKAKAKAAYKRAALLAVDTFARPPITSDVL
nr:uncharacterized protein LOC113806270 [Penaeus vannamei]